MDKDKEECMRVFKAALYCLNTQTGYPEMFIREIAMTAKCDAVHDMSKLRRDIEQDLGEDVMKRICAYTQTMQDERRATQILFRYRQTAKEELAKASKVWSPLALIGPALVWIGLSM